MAVHAGWKGTVLDITASTIQRMRDEFKTSQRSLRICRNVLMRISKYEDVAARFT
jgi:copper oxidase (laccase) domain-containing protein